MFVKKSNLSFSFFPSFLRNMNFWITNVINTVEKNTCFMYIYIFFFPFPWITMSSLRVRIFSSLNMEGVPFSFMYFVFCVFLNSLENEGIRRDRKHQAKIVHLFWRNRLRFESWMKIEASWMYFSTRIEASFRFEDFDFGVETRTRR